MENIDNKYYTPDITEFHVGFEYEYRKNKNNNWEEVACDLEVDPIGTLRDDIKNEKIRVKHLDREDIESLNWELDSCVRGECVFYHKSQNITTKNMHVLNWEESEENNINLYDVNDNFGTSFFGTIKNKSELKRLLKQLNIL